MSANILACTEHNYEYIDDVIVTNENFGNATPIMNATYHFTNIKIEQSLSRNKIPIIPGFIGKTINGETTTLGRGGSDLSATIIGQCIEASDISFYKVECDSKGNWKSNCKK